MATSQHGCATGDGKLGGRDKTFDILPDTDRVTLLLNLSLV